jgi:hypothetical protein
LRTAAARPIANRPQVDNLPHKKSSRLAKKQMRCSTPFLCGAGRDQQTKNRRLQAGGTACAALNLLLLALAIYAGAQLRKRWRAEKAREAAQIHRPAPSIPGPQYTPTPVPPPATPVNYVTIAQKDLFDRSRNPDVPVEVPPPPPKPPMPPLPVYHGAMNIGTGPMVFLSVSSNSPQLATSPGEMIGPFKLIDVTRQDLTLEWNGELIRKSLDELTSTSSAPPVEAGSDARTAAPTPQVQAKVEVPTAKGPGGDALGGSKLCQTNDTTPYGAVQDGFRKTEIKTPFGSACLWDPVNK